jgi:hypothetical protein
MKPSYDLSRPANAAFVVRRSINRGGYFAEVVSEDGSVVSLSNQPTRQQDRHGIPTVIDDRDRGLAEGRVSRAPDRFRYRLSEFLWDLG